MDPQEFTVKQATAADQIGTRVGHAYIITGILGTGGMGNVYRASQETIGRDVAIKFLPVEIAADATAVQRLGREAKALGQLNHPGIVTTFDFGFTDKQEPYLVLELVEGQSLHTVLEVQKRLELARALRIFVQICEAMSYAHSQGLVHRDLKPLNIMIGIREQFEFAKILDFGIVKLTSEVQQLTKSGEIWGSPFYMSPEQCTGGTVDNRSDIYSLGVVMFRCLTGEVPHRGANFPETIARKLSEYPPSFESIAPGLNLPEPVEKIVLKCLHKQPDERFESMQELRAELLKNYPNRNESEATLTYEKVDAVGANASTNVKADTPQPSVQVHKKEASKDKKDDNSGFKQLAIIVAALIILLGAFAAGTFAIYQNLQNSKANTTGGDTPINTKTAAPVKVEPVTQKIPQETAQDSIRDPLKIQNTEIPNTAQTASTETQKKPVKIRTATKKKTTSRTTNTVKAKAATAPPKSKLRDMLRRTGQEVLQEIKPFRRLRQNDPNSFYREFGGR